MWTSIAPARGERRVDVVALGESSLDFVALAGDAPAVAGKTALRDFELRPGGQCATAAVAVARMGLRARFVGAFGGDEWGARVQADLRASGVDVVPIVRDGTSSRIAVILVDRDGERQVYERRDPAARIGEAPAGAIEDGRVLLVDATDADASLAAARRARRAGIPVVVDVDRPGPEVDQLLREIDVVIAPLAFVTAVTGADGAVEGLRALAERYPRAAVLVATLGSAGSVAISGDRTIHTPGLAVTAVDTTGAGDTFRGAFAAAWIHLGPSADLEAVLAHANAAAALNCRGVGAQGALPTWTEVHACVTRGRVPGSKRIL